MRAINLNRITIVLSFIGLFIAGTLSLGKLLNAIPPCGMASSGCLKVETDPSSVWFGVPVAYVGFLAYAGLAALAVIRQKRGLGNSRMLVNLGYAGSAIGLMVSAFLTYYAISEIHATCIWCLSSASTMTALFILHAMLAQEDLPAEAPTGGTDFKLITGTAALAVVGLAGMGLQLRASMRKSTTDGRAYVTFSYDKFVPEGSHVQGNSNAKVTIVEFGDLYCPSCRANYGLVHDAIEGSNGKIKFVFRHMPMHMIPGHEFAFSAAILSEIAAEKGKFWEFLASAYAIEDEPKDLKPFLGVMSNLGIPQDNLDTRLTNDQDKAFKKVYDDLKFAESTGVRGTPSFFILREGKEPEAASVGDIRDFLGSKAAQ